MRLSHKGDGGRRWRQRREEVEDGADVRQIVDAHKDDRDMQNRMQENC